MSAVMESTGLSKASIYRLIKADDFPAAIRLCSRAVGWRAEQIYEWIASRDSAQPFRASRTRTPVNSTMVKGARAEHAQQWRVRRGHRRWSFRRSERPSMSFPEARREPRHRARDGEPAERESRATCFHEKNNPCMSPT